MIDNDTTPAPRRLLRLPEVIERTALSRTTIYRRERDGTFPKHVPLGGGRSAWVESEIDAWVGARINDRDDRAAA